MAGEIIVIGAGPAGLSVMAEAGYHEAGRVILLEKGDSHNQTVHQYYPDDKRVDAAYKGAEAVCAGVLCFRDTTKANFLDIAEQMVRLHPGEVHYGCHVDSVRKLPEGGFLVTSSDGREFRGEVAVIAIGRMGKPNRPDYFNQIPPTVRRLVQFDVRNLRPEGKSILVVGGGNSAIEFALSLNSRARTTVSYRGAAFNRLNAMNLSLLNEKERAGPGSSITSSSESGETAPRPFSRTPVSSWTNGATPAWTNGARRTWRIFTWPVSCRFPRARGPSS